MPTCLIALGANLGDRQGALNRAVELFHARRDIDVAARSRWHTTAPIGGPSGQAEFLNGAVRLETDLAPRVLLSVLRSIEQQLGRTAGQRWAPRKLDLDLLLYDRQVVDQPGLVVPHARMSFRRFVLVPAAEVARDMVHPTIGWTVGELLTHLNAAANYVAIAGPEGAGKTWLAERLVERFGGRMIRHVDLTERTPRSSGGRSGQAYDTEIRFLRDRAKRLARRDWASDERSGAAAAFAVSDFWFDQSLSYAGQWLGQGQFASFQAAWQAAQKSVVRPKLLVALDSPAPRRTRGSERVGTAAGRALSRERWSQVRQAIFDRVRLPGRGPTLWLSGKDRDEVLAEVMAAVEAMR